MTAAPPIALTGWLPLAQITRRLRLSYNSAYRRAAAGAFGEPIRIGNVLFFSEDHVEQHARSISVEAA